ncbi:MAG: hypothetical protein B6241_00705 [Spirochaetaceae bacterium 4572_59]|nr:MAG: hypothetical protein B6241_00705 [Spirochaetaceae bacterium 4572_59]
MEQIDHIAAFLKENDLGEKDLAGYLTDKGWGVDHPSTYRIDLESDFTELWKQASPYTMISMERGYAVYQGIHHILKHDLPGDFVECGVWKGGTCILMALTLLQAGCRDRVLWLYDTFSGMTEPGPEDTIASSGQAVSERWHKGWWAVSPENVLKNLLTTSYPENNFKLIEGDVCETLKIQKPESIALLRLDTDWYESTRVELEILYPLLVQKGVLIIDDYGHFSGSRQAVDEYFSVDTRGPLMQRSDYTGRLAVKLN